MRLLSSMMTVTRESIDDGACPMMIRGINGIFMMNDAHGFSLL
jgi:hypothetical protein